MSDSSLRSRLGFSDASIAGFGLTLSGFVGFMGIVTAELTSVARPTEVTTRTCPACLSEGHRSDARFCRDCGEPLPERQGRLGGEPGPSA